jgi:hypothetical protein
MNAVILSAGRATRLGGINKLTVSAGGRKVHEWHQRLLAGYTVAAVVDADSADEITSEAQWLDEVISHTAYDGPAGALLAYLDRHDDEGELIVLFADTLLRNLPNTRGNWVAMASAPSRVWDYYEEGEWRRGAPRIPVCVGLYQFDCTKCLQSTIQSLISTANTSEISLADVLSLYGITHQIQRIDVDDWQDAGDMTAIEQVRP